MKLVIGLGNPTAEYANTRHNLGFICLDKWAAQKKKDWSQDTLFDFIQTRSTVLIKPKTWMNRSGVALEEALRRWKINDVLVVYDDLELAPAVLRIRQGGGDGGHNGIKSLFDVKRPDELKRIRIGIGRSSTLEPHDHVLGEMGASEQEILAPALELAVKLTDTYVRSDFSQVLNEYSNWKKSYSTAKSSGIVSPKEEINDKGL
ncbi:MAG TPA: aminoacyl-tRNA hydrolase [Candidatus Cloacimonas sp.]|jgi:PTH1 family peptidyl-tRNA hydrolase|nr:aminoacyl-tRNA hydrolase [Candidatus Cloacimonas sp.]